jgi:hypothetical protein
MAMSFAAAALSLAAGCAPMSVLSGPHQPYAPMLDHAGQLDIVARGGGMADDFSQWTMTSAVQVAYAPIDHLEIAASADADLFDTDERNHTLHVGGGLAIGAFARAGYFRFEAFVGANAGWGAGFVPAEQRTMPAMPFGMRTGRVELSYQDAFVQAQIGGDFRYFEFVIGARYLLHVGQGASILDGAPTQFTQGIAGPFGLVRVPVDVIHFEIMVGSPILVSGTPPLDGAPELGWWPFVVGGIGVQLDTLPSR